MLSKDKKDLIIVTCDFTEQAETALSHASRIAQESEDEVRLLHIINNDSKSKLKKKNAGEELIFEELKKWADKNKSETGVNTTYHAEEGSIFTTIGEYITDSDASLVVLGTHGIKGIQHIVGAFALKVISSSPVPVIVVQSKRIDTDGYKKIILPIDHNKHGKNKIAYAIAVAKYFNGEVHVFESRETDSFIANTVSQNSLQAQNIMKEQNIPYFIVQEKGGEGSFTKQLVRYGSEINADLIVISSEHDTQGVADLILGKNESQIINNDAQIAVMCVNPIQDTSHLGVYG